MALKLVMFIAMAIVPAIVGATEYVVGEEQGWTLGVNYTKWAEGKEFKVGDQITFNYVKGSHNVLKVRGAADFNSCNKKGEVPPLTSGNNSFIFITGGRKWYICAFEDHCQRGMKLSINVEEAEAPAPSPTGGYDNSAGKIATFGYYKYLVGLAALFGVVVML